MRTTFRLTILLLCSALAAACAHDVLDSPIPEETACGTTEKPIGLDPETETLTATDAGTVALMFKNQSQQSRSASEATVRNIVTIPGKDGQAALYAVNLDKGYVIVPATKNLPPILAIVDSGEFSLDEEPFGRDVLISQMVDEIDYWKTKEPNHEHETAWRTFNKHKVQGRVPVSRADPNPDVWYAQSEIMYELSLEGYTCYEFRKMEEEQEDIPKDILQRFQNRARYEENRWEDEDEDMMYKTAFIAVKDYRDGGHSSSSYLLKTHWHQRSPYNNSLSTNRPLGCVTIAVGQIMKYYNYPTSFNWADMPNEEPNTNSQTTTSNFLKKIHDDLGVNDNAGATIGDAERVLKSYGYSVKQINHSYGVYKNFPTYCRGTDTSKKAGHAWVCDGKANIYSGMAYELYILDCAYYPEFYFYKIDEVLDQTSYSLYHINWGWAAKSDNNGTKLYYDGFFYDGSMNINTTDGLYQFNNDRKDLVISKP